MFFCIPVPFGRFSHWSIWYQVPGIFYRYSAPRPCIISVYFIDITSLVLIILLYFIDIPRLVLIILVYFIGIQRLVPVILEYFIDIPRLALTILLHFGILCRYSAVRSFMILVYFIDIRPSLFSSIWYILSILRASRLPY